MGSRRVIHRLVDNSGPAHQEQAQRGAVETSLWCRRKNLQNASERTREELLCPGTVLLYLLSKVKSAGSRSVLLFVIAQHPN